jgi:RNA polymerase sigma-H factor
LSYDEARLLLLVEKARNKDNAAFAELMRIFEPELRMIAQRLYIAGSDSSDVLQETYIGLWSAVEKYSEESGTSFHHFAINVCCKRRIYTSIKSSNGKKFKIHNTAESLDRPIVTDDDDSSQTLADFLVDHNPSPLDIIINQSEYSDNVGELESRMTGMEKTVFNSYKKDHTYHEIGEELDIKPKAADNALMRIRKKASKIYQEYTADGILQEEKSTHIVEFSD